MAKLYEIDKNITDWLATRPPVIKEMFAKRPGNLLYKLKDTGHRVTIFSYSENNTVTVTVSGEFNLIDFERNVFGISLDDLEECDLPGDDELLGVLITDKTELDEHIQALRDKFKDKKD